MQSLATPLSIHLSLGEPNMAPDPRMRDHAIEVAARGSWKYTPNAGMLELRRRLAESEAAHYEPESEICVTAGTEEGLHAIFHAYIGPGDEVLVPDPGFVSYPALTRMAGGEPRSYPLDPDGWTLDFDALEAGWGPRVKAIVVNSPSNPTGGVIGESQLRKLVELAESRGALVISDEVYGAIHYGSSAPPSLMGRGDHVIVVSGLSKSHAMTGLRLGWVLASAETLKPVIKAHQYIATCASAFSQQLAIRLLADSEWNQEWLSRVRAQMREQRDAAVEAARKWLEVEVSPPEGAFYLFVPLPVCGTAGLAKQLAIEAAVLTIPGVAFGSRGEGFLRISYATDIESIRKGIERIGRFLQSEGR